MGYPDLISVLVRNLVDNAARYSPVGGSVCVDVAQAGNGARIRVTDEGPGIAPQEREKIGQRFYRILGTGQSGSGLGLSIVRRIVEMHAAQLRFEEGGNRRGLRVVVEFRTRGPAASARTGRA
jgi:signal transduction histidine kinase